MQGRESFAAAVWSILGWMGAAFATMLAVGALLCYRRIDLLVIAAFLGFIPFAILRARRKGTVDIFSPEVGFPVVFVAYMFVGSINLPITTQFGLTIPWTQWLYYILGIGAYFFGTSMIVFRMPQVPLQRKPFWDSGKFGLMVLFLLVLGASGRAVTIARYGLPLLHPEHEELRVMYAGGFVGTFALALEAAFLCLLLFLLVRKPSRKLTLAVIFVMLLLLLDTVTGGNRGGLMRIGIAGLVLIHYARQRLRFRILAVFALAGIVAIALIGTYRDTSMMGESHIESLETSGFGSSFYWLASGYDVLRLPAQDFRMLTEQYPAQDSYTYGATSLAAIATPLPGHRPSPGELIKKTLGLNFIGFGAAATMLGALYMDGGWLAIAFGMMLLGILAQWLYRRMALAGNHFWLLVYAWFLQNQFKAIKDEILPDLGVVFALCLFAAVHMCASHGLCVKCYMRSPGSLGHQ